MMAWRERDQSMLGIDSLLKLYANAIPERLDMTTQNGLLFVFELGIQRPSLRSTRKSAGTTPTFLIRIP
jgi:hypothetical protein